MASSDETKATGKGRPTPKRKEQEALKKRPLVQDRKASSRANRERQAAQRQKEYAAMQSGDVRNMPLQHQGEVRAYARDYIDARTTIGEFMLPIALFALGAYFFAGAVPQVAAVASLVVLAFMFAWIIDTFLTTRRVKKLATAKFGASKMPRGFAFYCVTRMSQLRALRMPKPRVKRREFPT